jgi:hypothetical protein
LWRGRLEALPVIPAGGSPPVHHPHPPQPPRRQGEYLPRLCPALLRLNTRPSALRVPGGCGFGCQAPP